MSETYTPTQSQEEGGKELWLPEHARKWGFYDKLNRFARRVASITGLPKRKVLEKIQEVFEAYEPRTVPGVRPVETDLTETYKLLYVYSTWILVDKETGEDRVKLYVGILNC